jgi:hypothetical protein
LAADHNELARGLQVLVCKQLKRVVKEMYVGEMQRMLSMLGPNNQYAGINEHSDDDNLDCYHAVTWLVQVVVRE